MKGYFQRELMILPSLTDPSGRLSIPSTFAFFMDMAAEHAEMLGTGLTACERDGTFWLTVKTKICFHRRPRIPERVTVATWPEPPKRIRCNRSYEMTSGGETLITGKTEWAMIDVKTGSLRSVTDVFTPDKVPDRPPACPEPFARIDEDFTGAETLEDYRVRATDIDIGGHMNNAAYIRAIFGAMQDDEIKLMHIRAADVVYRASCFENDILRIERRRTDSVSDFRLSKDGQTVLLARFA